MLVIAGMVSRLAVVSALLRSKCELCSTVFRKLVASSASDTIPLTPPNARLQLRPPRSPPNTLQADPGIRLQVYPWPGREHCIASGSAARCGSAPRLDPCSSLRRSGLLVGMNGKNMFIVGNHSCSLLELSLGLPSLLLDKCRYSPSTLFSYRRCMRPSSHCKC